jgi:hypothetical protein
LRSFFVALSRRHCEVGRDPCGAWFRYLGSRGPICVNNHITQDTRLRHGDTIKILAAAVLRLSVTGADPAWFVWHGGAVPQLAQSIHDNGHFGDLPLLADMLTDAGCTDADILGHLRGGGEHVRGCWVVDLLLEKE